MSREVPGAWIVPQLSARAGLSIWILRWPNRRPPPGLIIPSEKRPPPTLLDRTVEESGNEYAWRDFLGRARYGHAGRSAGPERPGALVWDGPGRCPASQA